MANDENIPTKTPPWWENSPQAEEGARDLSDEDKIVQWVNETCWSRWDNAYRAWERQVEENVRMVIGRQYDIYVDSVSDFVDMTRWFFSEDERWRQNPVFNFIAHYYKLTLAKLTENAPTLVFGPTGPDWEDAALARVMGPMFRIEWKQMRMPEKMYSLYAWVITAGRAITRLRWDPDRGPQEDFRADATIELMAENNQLTQRQLSQAPYVRNNEGMFVPNVLLDDEGNAMMRDGELQMGPPESTRLGDLAFDVLAPTSVRTPHGPEPFYEKPWYTHEYLMPVEDVHRFHGVELEPDDLSPDDSDLWVKLSFGQNYGMPGSFTRNSLSAVEGISLTGYVRIREHWRMDRPNHDVLGKGRLTIVAATQQKLLYDDINPYWVDGVLERAINPFDAFDAVVMPFRNEGMSDIELQGPINKALNRRMHATMDSVDHNEQPALFYDRNAVAEEDLEDINRPGVKIPANFSASQGPPVIQMPAADLPRASIELADRLQQWMQLFGSQPFGSEGLPVTGSASGELQREVRFDTDRVWGATLRLHSWGWTRIGLKMADIMASCLSDERIMVMMGDDQVPEFITVSEQLFQGRIHVEPAPESQIFESRAEKTARILLLVDRGVLPPEQAAVALDMPDLTRAMRPGGPAYALASQELLEMALGQIPAVLPEHDHASHLFVIQRFMQTTHYRDLAPEIQSLFRTHKLMHEVMQMSEAVRLSQLANVAVAASQPEGDALGGAPNGNGQEPEADDGRAPNSRELGGQAGTPGGADPRRTAEATR